MYDNQANRASLTGAAPISATVQTEIEGIRHHIQLMEKQVFEFGQRLSPVLQPMPSAVNESNGAGGLAPETNIVRQLTHIRGMMDNLSSSLDRLSQRLEL